MAAEEIEGEGVGFDFAGDGDCGAEAEVIEGNPVDVGAGHVVGGDDGAAEVPDGEGDADDVVEDGIEAERGGVDGAEDLEGEVGAEFLAQFPAEAGERGFAGLEGAAGGFPGRFSGAAEEEKAAMGIHGEGDDGDGEGGEAPPTGSCCHA